MIAFWFLILICLVVLILIVGHFAGETIVDKTTDIVNDFTVENSDDESCLDKKRKGDI